jgi:hypothetical protein
MVSKAVAQRRASALDFVLFTLEIERACKEPMHLVQESQFAKAASLLSMHPVIRQSGARQTDTPAAQPRARRNR